MSATEPVLSQKISVIRDEIMKTIWWILQISSKL